MAFPLELDHIVVCASVHAPEARSLKSLGLTGFGGTTRHGDLGTASTALFFTNTYSDDLSTVVQMLSTNVVATIKRGGAPLMTLTFDGGRQRKTVDMRPALPL